MKNHPTLVVIGGGFGGIELIKKLRNKPFDIILVDRNNHHTFQPLLYQVASCGLADVSITSPFRRIFRGVKNFRFRMADVSRIDPEKQLIITDIGEIPYDILVIATGSTSNFYGNQNLEKNSLSLKSVADALTIRNTLLREFEEAITRSHVDDKKVLLNFVIIGAGSTGVEIAGSLAEFKKHIVPFDYPELDPGLMNIHLIEAADRVLPMMTKKSSEKADEYLTKMGVKVWLNTKVQDYDGLNVTLTDGTVLRSVAFIWSAGVKGAVIEGLKPDSIFKGNRYVVDVYNKVNGYDNIYALGDVAAMISDKRPAGHPLLALPAIQQGHNLARNLLSTREGRPLNPFTYNDLGIMSTIGRNQAVAELRFGRFHGFIAWFMWMFVHLIRLVGFRNRLSILSDWIWNYFTYEYTFRIISQPFRKTRCRDCEE
ncbi:MAG: NAD(P)/FAD-dependent oxidoreductase [Bacteroidales bacterium]|nr:NAD(P)/FAD-dependent oxidoreductase [Bacteroidales bacterium]